MKVVVVRPPECRVGVSRRERDLATLIERVHGMDVPLSLIHICLIRAASLSKSRYFFTSYIKLFII